MSTIRRLERLAKRVGKVLTIERGAHITEATRKMTENDVGCLIVLDGRRIIGILSERDIVSRLAGTDGQMSDHRAEDVMTTNIVSCEMDTEISQAQRLMAAHGIRHLPVIEDGMPVGMISSRDVLACKLYDATIMLSKANKEAEEAQNTKCEALANVGHQIRTPINGILGMTELALETALSDEQAEYLRYVKSSAESLMDVVNNMLEYSQIKAGRAAMEPAEFDVRQTVTELVERFGKRAGDRQVKLVHRVADDVPQTIRGDGARLGQVLANLLDNALKFTEAGVVIIQVERESVTRDQAVLHFSVKDTGIGIREADRQKIFEAFQQGDESPGQDHRGTGLGLTIAAQLVGLMGGKLWVDSKEGNGSVFQFTASFGLTRQAAPAGRPTWKESPARPPVPADEAS